MTHTHTPKIDTQLTTNYKIYTTLQNTLPKLDLTTYIDTKTIHNNNALINNYHTSTIQNNNHAQKYTATIQNNINKQIHMDDS